MDYNMEQEYENRRFVIFEVTELPLIDFNQVYETNADTVRKSVDETKTFVKYDLPEPSSVTTLTTKSQEYTYDEILQILSTPEWTEPYPSI
jgi:homogentisate 1,2-dioxygenase